MDVYFARIKMMMDTEGLNSRLRFMLLVGYHPDVKGGRKRFADIVIGRYRSEKFRLGVQGCRERSQDYPRDPRTSTLLQYVL